MIINIVLIITSLFFLLFGCGLIYLFYCQIRDEFLKSIKDKNNNEVIIE